MRPTAPYVRNAMQYPSASETSSAAFGIIFLYICTIWGLHNSPNTRNVANHRRLLLEFTSTKYISYLCIMGIQPSLNLCKSLLQFPTEKESRLWPFSHESISSTGLVYLGRELHCADFESEQIRHVWIRWLNYDRTNQCPWRMKRLWLRAGFSCEQKAGKLLLACKRWWPQHCEQFY